LWHFLLLGVLLPFTASPQVKFTVDANTAFALDLYQALKARPGNLFFSPYNISTALAMTYAGARGQTATEMARMLHFDSAQDNPHSTFAELATRMNRIQLGNRITLLTANSLWCQRDYQFTTAYLNLVHEFYHADAMQVDFANDAPGAARAINTWVEHQTQGKIQNAVKQEQLDRAVDLVLCNAIYFQGQWQHQFEKSDTRSAPFHVATNEIVTVPMMNQEDHFKLFYSEPDSVALLELPYSGTNLSMVILLPEMGDLRVGGKNPGLSVLEQELTADNLRRWLASLDQSEMQQVSISLPRLTASQSLDLVKALKSLGMTSAFDANTANFSGMDGISNSLFISDVIHKAFVEVNEWGSEAAAATSVSLSRGITWRFNVDHPFIFLIRDNGSGSILFIGRIVDPTR